MKSYGVNSIKSSPTDLENICDALESLKQFEGMPNAIKSSSLENEPDPDNNNGRQVTLGTQ